MRLEFARMIFPLGVRIFLAKGFCHYIRGCRYIGVMTKSRLVQVRMSPGLVERIDEAATQRGRSRFIIEAVEVALNPLVVHRPLPPGLQERFVSADPRGADRAARSLPEVLPYAPFEPRHLATCSCAVCKPGK